MNLIDTLQATLKLDNNTKDRESPESETEIKNHGKLFSIEKCCFLSNKTTLHHKLLRLFFSGDVGQSASGRLKNRINRLRRYTGIHI